MTEPKNQLSIVHDPEFDTSREWYRWVETYLVSHNVGNRPAAIFVDGHRMWFHLGKEIRGKTMENTS